MREDEPTGFARAVVELLLDPASRAALGESARHFALSLPAWADAVAALLGVYKWLLGTHPGGE